MTIVIRALSSADKSSIVSKCVGSFREGRSSPQIFEFNVREFESVPGTPFAYWLQESMLKAFEKLPKFESAERMARAGMQTSNDFAHGGSLAW
jgi:hypothetical protein